MKRLRKDIKTNIKVYLHRRVSDNQIFYVGIGAGKRPYDNKRRNIFWKRYTSKYDYIVDILHENISWKEACEIEKSLILKYGRRNLGKGTLVNLTNGGEGVNGLKKSQKYIDWLKANHPTRDPEVRKKISESKKGKTTWMKGRTHTEEAKQKNREKHLGNIPPNKGIPSPYRGIPRPEHSKLMLGAGNSNAKLLTCLITGQIYQTVKDYIKAVGIKNYYQFTKLVKLNKIKVTW